MPPSLSTPPSPYLLTTSLNLNLTNHETLHFHTNTPPYLLMHANDEYIGTVCSVIALVFIMSYLLYRLVSGNVPQLRASALWRRYMHPKGAIRRVIGWVLPLSTAQECEDDVELVVWDSENTTLQGSVKGNGDDGRFYDENGFVWVDL
jgi:hypothetical protein